MSNNEIFCQNLFLTSFLRHRFNKQDEPIQSLFTFLPLFFSFFFFFFFFFCLHDLNDFSFHKQVEVSCCLLFCVVIYFYIISLLGFLCMSYKMRYKLNEYPYKIILQVSTTSIYLTKIFPTSLYLLKIYKIKNKKNKKKDICIYKNSTCLFYVRILKRYNDDEWQQWIKKNLNHSL